jgi:hypothetical protein
MRFRRRERELSASDWARIESALHARVALLTTQKIHEVVTRYFDPQVAREMRDDVLGRIANDGELHAMLRAVAKDGGEHAAKSYIAHVLGYRIELTVGEALNNLEPVVPERPPSAEEHRDFHPPNHR